MHNMGVIVIIIIIIIIIIMIIIIFRTMKETIKASVRTNVYIFMADLNACLA